MDRIDKFLNRRKQKDKKTIKCKGKYYEVTKEDLKIVKKYKKNICMDESVDLYRPYKLNFTENPLEDSIFTDDSNHSKKRKVNIEKLKKQIKEDVIREDVNEIHDIWEDDNLDSLRNYDQELVFKVKEQYNKPIEDLKLDQEILSKEIRKIYLTQFLPRETKTYRLKDLLKPLPEKDSLKPFPEDIAKIYHTTYKKFAIDSKNYLLAVWDQNVFEIVEIRNFVSILKVSLENKISNVKFGKDEHIFVSSGNQVIIIRDIFKFLKIKSQDVKNENTKEEKEVHIFDDEDNQGKLCEYKNIECKVVTLKGINELVFEILETKNKIIDFDIEMNHNYITLITGRSCIMSDIVSKKSKVICKLGGDLLLNVKFHLKRLLVVIGTSNGVCVCDAKTNKIISNLKNFSYIVDQCYTENDYLVLVNNNRRIIIYDFTRNMILHTMTQDSDIIKVVKHKKYPLCHVITSNESIVFYLNEIQNEHVPVKRIEILSKYTTFHNSMPWIYFSARNDDKVYLLT